MTENVRVHIFVSGRVQGVFFRSRTQDKARELGLTGWVKNLSGGRLEAVFEGDKAKVGEMLEWAKIGPPGAKVENLDLLWEEYKAEFNDFEIRHD